MSNEQDKQKEQMTPEYWWRILQEKGKWWLHGNNFTREDIKLFRETNNIQRADYRGYDGERGLDDQHYDLDNNTPDRYLEVARHYDPLFFLKEVDPGVVFVIEEEKKDKSDRSFSLQFERSYPPARGHGSSVDFNFSLPKQEASQFAEAVKANPQLVWDLMLSRYANLNNYKGAVADAKPGFLPMPKRDKRMAPRGRHMLLIVDNVPYFFNKETPRSFDENEEFYSQRLSVRPLSIDGIKAQQSECDELREKILASAKVIDAERAVRKNEYEESIAPKNGILRFFRRKQ